MKAIGRFNVLLFFLLAAYLLSACSGTATPATGGSDESVPSPVAFTGLVENIVGNQWTINGVTVTVDPAVVQNGPFSVGDQVKVEGVVSQDGALTISRVEPASPEDLSTLPEFGDGSNANSNEANANDNGNTNTNDDNSNNANSNDTNANDDNGNDSNADDDNGNVSNSNDDNGNDDNGSDSNSNDDNDDNNSNSNDDDDSGSNSNDDNDNDDNENDD